MYLGKARVRKRGSTQVRAEGGRHVTAFGVCGQIKHVAVAAGGKNHRACRPRANLTRDQITGDDAPRLPVDQHQVQHLGAHVHLNRAFINLPMKGGNRTQKQLLTRLTPSIERTRDQRPSKRPVCQQTAVLSRERHPLRNTLINNVVADLRETINILFSTAEIPSLNRVVEKSVDRVAIVGVVFGGVDSSLGGDAVRTARAVVKTETVDLVAQLGQRGRRGSPCQARAHNNDVELALVRRANQLDLGQMPLPLVLERTGGNLGVESHDYHALRAGSISPSNVVTGIAMFPTTTITATPRPSLSSKGRRFARPQPVVWNALAIP